MHIVLEDSFEPPPQSFLTAGVLASMYSPFAAEDTIHGSITYVKIKILNGIIVPQWLERGGQSCLLG